MCASEFMRWCVCVQPYEDMKKKRTVSQAKNSNEQGARKSAGMHCENQYIYMQMCYFNRYVK